MARSRPSGSAPGRILAPGRPDLERVASVGGQRASTTDTGGACLAACRLGARDDRRHQRVAHGPTRRIAIVLGLPARAERSIAPMFGPPRADPLGVSVGLVGNRRVCNPHHVSGADRAARDSRSGDTPRRTARCNRVLAQPRDRYRRGAVFAWCTRSICAVETEEVTLFAISGGRESNPRLQLGKGR